MRKVMVSREAWSKENSRMEHVDLYEAWFHQFSTDSCEDISGPFAVALVERISDGKVDMVFPGNIRFLDQPSE